MRRKKPKANFQKWATEIRAKLLDMADLTVEGRRILESMRSGNITFKQRMMLKRMYAEHFPAVQQETRAFWKQVEAIRREAYYGENSESAAQRDPAIPLEAEGAESEAIGSSKQAK